MREYDNFGEKFVDPISIRAIKISLANPDDIVNKWSHGEVKKPETINYRTFKPEKDGLFCAKIFGPQRDYECNCGKYKRPKYKGQVCEKCGVEIISSKVRRERMGHIVLATPIAHIWFFKSPPSRIGAILDISLKNLERVLYYESYIVLDEGTSELKFKEILTEEEYQYAIQKYGEGSFRAGMGGEAIRELLQKVDLNKLSDSLRQQIQATNSEAIKKNLAKRLSIIDAFRETGQRPEWMILTILPVIPPELRPLVPLEGGRFATSDLNDLYRRVINRNNRLKKLIELNAPDIIIKNEKRMLQEAVDSLFENGRRGKPIMGPHKRPLRSLSDMIKGKQGRFRQNLLGKRVDFSGRTVIVVGPELKLHQCGLPKKMALELFKPFIYNKLEERGRATSIKQAKKEVEMETPEVWDILDEVVREHPVLLNRAPTLHRLGIQAFEPVLTEHLAIQLHPLVCVAFNADFDGDQMAVHVPISIEAQVEARVLMLSTNNLLSPANGKPIIVPTQDIVLGINYLTKEMPFAKGENLLFSSPEEVRIAYDHGEVTIHTIINVRMKNGERVRTTVGRILLYEIIPEEISFDIINKPMTKNDLANLLDICFRKAGAKKLVIFADHLMRLGFYYATKAGISIGIDDIKVPPQKGKIIDEAFKEIKEIEQQYLDGLITETEKYNQAVDIWTDATEKITEEMMKQLAYEKVRSRDGREAIISSFNPIYLMTDSGARGSTQQIRQLAGMRGLMYKPSGEIIETPITSNFREKLSVLQYFISTHGARKGLADTALKTANSGYLTRRLVDVAQDVLITEEDCGTPDGIEISALVVGSDITAPISLSERIIGRFLAEDIIDINTGEVLFKAKEEIDEEKAAIIERMGIEKLKIRSVLTCKSKWGICATCYGRDLSRGRKVNIGEAVGIIAAQSIGEPGTQLTMRTFHMGGAITEKVVQSSFEAKNSGIIDFINLKSAKMKDGNLRVMIRNSEIVIKDENENIKEKYILPYGSIVHFKKGDRVQAGQIIARWDPYNIPILCEVEGKVKFGDLIEGTTIQESFDEITGYSMKTVIPYKDHNLRPRISIKDLSDSKTTIGRYFLAVGANIEVSEGQIVYPGDTLAKIPRETIRTKDITGGLPRVSELFEARKPKEEAIISEIAGTVRFGKMEKGRVRIIIEPPVGEKKEYLIPKGKHITVHEGEIIKEGEPLMDGSPDPKDILRVKGEKELARYLVNEIQKLYRVQGVRINDKHIEVIVRQMLRKRRITDPGDSKFIIGEIVDRVKFDEVNERLKREKKKLASAEPVLQGITKASLSTESFISAASFQETTRVLTEAAIRGKVDNLRGLKENVIMGRIIPGGTGFAAYKKLGIRLKEDIERDLEEEIEKEGLFRKGEREIFSS